MRRKYCFNGAATSLLRNAIGQVKNNVIHNPLQWGRNITAAE